jgi:hypothetical protein
MNNNTQPPIFRVLKYIMVDKKKWNELDEEEQKSFNNYMINRFLSMNESWIEVVNTIQKNTWQMKGEYLYNLYKDLIPKGYVWSKYIKASNKKEYKPEEVKAVMEYYTISSKDAKEYIDMLPKDELELITQQISGK